MPITLSYLTMLTALSYKSGFTDTEAVRCDSSTVLTPAPDRRRLVTGSTVVPLTVVGSRSGSSTPCISPTIRQSAKHVCTVWSGTPCLRVTTTVQTSTSYKSHETCIFTGLTKVLYCRFMTLSSATSN